jgi:hypothetical protein
LSRNYEDWLAAYVEYASFSEAPKRMHFWSGVSAIAGALRRRVYIEQAYFRWHANFYIVLVAPPGVVSKSTTATIAMSLLKQVSSARFGPDIVTWPALVKSFAEANESFESPLGSGDWIAQCALTLESSEFGNLVNPSDREMIDILVNLWDGKQGAFSKVTKGNGIDVIENPWINLIACTTPAWIAGNFPEYVIGGGFTSRCLFVYADTKDKYIAYPEEHIPADFYSTQERLVSDLEHIATTMVGRYVLTPEAKEWGRAWYKHHWEHKPDELDDDRFSGYLSRKQTHVHKTAMILSAARHDNLVIEKDDLFNAALMVTDLEKDMQKVFARIGRTVQSVQAERFVRFIQRNVLVSYAAAYQYVHTAFPDIRNFDGIVRGAISAGYIEPINRGGETYLRARGELPKKLDS